MKNIPTLAAALLLAVTLWAARPVPDRVAVVGGDDAAA